MIDAIDRKLLHLLQRGSDQPIASLAELVGLSQSACHRRIKRLETDGYILGYGARVDRRKAGLSVFGYVSVKMESHDAQLLSAFTRGVEAIDEIVACHAISGRGDYLLEVVTQDMDSFAHVALERLVKLPGVKDSTTDFVLSTIKNDIEAPIQLVNSQSVANDS